MTGAPSIINAAPGTPENAAKLCLQDVVSHYAAFDKALRCAQDVAAGKDTRGHYQHERRALATMHVRAAMALGVPCESAAFELIK